MPPIRWPAFAIASRCPKDVIYLDGNSLGALPAATPARVAEVVSEQWGEGLIRSWNSASWIDLPQRIGDKIAPLMGAEPGEVIACDTTSVNLFKLIAAALALRPGRKVILSEPGNFPTDLYMIDGLEKQGLAERRLADRDALTAALGEDTALLLLTHAHYKTGELFDMAALTGAAHEAGALVLWDLSHSAGALPVDLDACQADFAVGCGYKYLNGGPGVAGLRLCRPAAPGGFASTIDRLDGACRSLCVCRQLYAGPRHRQVAVRDSADPRPRRAGGGGRPGRRNRCRAASRQVAGVESEFFLECLAASGAEIALVSPADAERRGSQLSFRHPEAYAICQALIARGVIGDFRDPDILRLGFAPAYLRYEDMVQAARHLAEVLESGEWQKDGVQPARRRDLTAVRQSGQRQALPRRAT